MAGALSGGNVPRNVKEKIFTAQGANRIFVLESFYYVNDLTEKFIPCLDKFMLDSGAFTFMMQRKAGQNIDWDEYIERYADFINRNKVDLFFELDIDCIVGIKEVERLRNRLERLTCKPCIPVWHKPRGPEYFLRMCDEYKYVSLGGIGDEIFRGEFKYFPWFIDQAHKRGCKIHGLGFTDLKGMEKCHFDSVDSTSWTSGNRFGVLHIFNGKTMLQKKRKPNERMVNIQEMAFYNFNEWVKFQRYAEKYL